MSESLSPTWAPNINPPEGKREYRACRARVLDAVKELAGEHGDTSIEAIEAHLGEAGRVFPNVQWHLVLLGDYCEIEMPDGRVRLRGDS